MWFTELPPGNVGWVALRSLRPRRTSVSEHESQTKPPFRIGPGSDRQRCREPSQSLRRSRNGGRHCGGHDELHVRCGRFPSPTRAKPARRTSRSRRAAIFGTQKWRSLKIASLMTPNGASRSYRDRTENANFVHWVRITRCTTSTRLRPTPSGNAWFTELCSVVRRSPAARRLDNDVRYRPRYTVLRGSCAAPTAMSGPQLPSQGDRARERTRRAACVRNRSDEQDGGFYCRRRGRRPLVYGSNRKYPRDFVAVKGRIRNALPVCRVHRFGRMLERRQRGSAASRSRRARSTRFNLATGHLEEGLEEEDQTARAYSGPTSPKSGYARFAALHSFRPGRWPSNRL